jgi:hypothetical protein
MNLSADFLKALAVSADRSADPLRIVWPAPGNPVALVEFCTFAEWRDFVFRLGMQRATPDIVRLKFERAQKLYLLAWLDFDLIKAGELVALTTLELALKDRYGDKVRDNKGQMNFSRLLRYMPAHDGLTDAKIPMIQRSGGAAIGFLTGDTQPSLSEIRNKLAHGYPFDGFAYGGLLELVRDLIEYAYRDWP